jgi:hypothetical protein
MAILRGDGIEFGGGHGFSSAENLQTSGWFTYRFTRTSGFGFGDPWVEGQQTGNMALPPRAKIFIYTYTPLRSDSTSWGGHYEDLQYSINGGAWTSVGRSGFVSVMHTNQGLISKHTDFCVMDFNSITTDFNLNLRTLHRWYNAGGSVISSVAIVSGDNNPTGGNQQNAFFKQIIVMGYGQGPST